MLNEVEKFGLSVSEIAVLRHIHGADSVVNLIMRSNDRKPIAGERERLDNLYGPKATHDIFGVGVGNMPQDLDDEEEARIATSAKAKKAALEKSDEDFESAVQAEVERRMAKEADAKTADKAVANG